METLDQILQNIRNDTEHYNRGTTELQYMQEEQRS